MKTATLLVLLLAQVVVVQPLPDAGGVFEHDATATLLVLLLPQLVATQLLPKLAGMDAHDETPIGPVVAVLHVVATQLFPGDRRDRRAGRRQPSGWVRSPAAGRLSW